ncbi:hypothetical protein SAMN05444156_1134 [Verrucomicrobium sp. GAS474]|uniref:hypothetical protein n=1 Tax=Verrucomicrobium sp. GAS474 TaxID=1882831 RepID=UPI00087D556B|nr:hypothetical protein [Verrucomicrobium sp. GAS474]SDT96754.1 hypothetical protein SAMN05444156_1134 [Verrucomicrobium sp. GAS474]
MSYSELSERLSALAITVREHQNRLEGKPLATSARKLNTALANFEKVLHDFFDGNGPGIRELTDLLKSPQARNHLKGPGLKIAFRDLLDKPLPEGTPARAKAIFLEKIAKKEKGEEAVAYLREFFLKAAAPASIPKEKEALQKEFVRLGGLDDTDLELEFEKRWKKLTDLKKLATANGITITAKTSKERLIDHIVHYARRAHSNVGPR